MPKTYPIMEHFYTLQGEGVYHGYPAYFVRMAGCDVGCVWCDVKESWGISPHQYIDTDDIVSSIVNTGTQIAVITGGEPTMHDLTDLTTNLKAHNIRTHIETSGTNALTGNWDWVCFSPKRYKKPLVEYFDIANEFKVIIFTKNDLRWARSFEEKLNPRCKLLIQVEWDKKDELYQECIEFVKQNPIWSLSIQSHKYINIP